MKLLMTSLCLLIVVTASPGFFQQVDSIRPTVKNTELLEDSIRYTIQRGSEIRFVQLQQEGKVRVLTVQDEQGKMRAFAISSGDDSDRPAIVIRFGLAKSIADPATDTILKGDIIEKLPLPKGAEDYSWKNTFITRTAKCVHRGVILKVAAFPTFVQAKKVKLLEGYCESWCIDSACACFKNAFCAYAKCEIETCKKREWERMLACLGTDAGTINL
jgi:hypothetical protein